MSRPPRVVAALARLVAARGALDAARHEVARLEAEVARCEEEVALARTDPTLAQVIETHPDLGRVPDREVAAAVGCTVSHVALVRRRLGVPAWRRVPDRLMEALVAGWGDGVRTLASLRRQHRAHGAADIRRAVGRLAEEGRVERVRTGYYRLSQNVMPGASR